MSGELRPHGGQRNGKLGKKGESNRDSRARSIDMRAPSLGPGKWPSLCFRSHQHSRPLASAHTAPPKGPRVDLEEAIKRQVDNKNQVP